MPKFNLIFLSLFLFISQIGYAETLGNLSSNQLIEMQKNKNALVIDIRTEEEWGSTGIIPNSYKLQFFSAKGKFDAEKWLAKLNQLKSSAEQPVILVCKSGNRSHMVGNMLTKQQNMKNIYHLSKGIKQWINNNHNLAKDSSIDRSQ